MKQKTLRRKTVSERSISTAADMLAWLESLKAEGLNLGDIRMNHPRPRFAEVYAARVVMVPFDDGSSAPEILIYSAE